MKYQIKARRLASPATSRQLSTIRNLDQEGFDHLIVVLFGPRFEVTGCWQIPISVVHRYATYQKHVNGHILHATEAVLADAEIFRLHLNEPAPECSG